MTGMKATLVGEPGFERATVWCVVGFAVAVTAIGAAVRFGIPPIEWIPVACVSIASIGAIAFVRSGGGVAPSAVLVYGPFAGALLAPIDVGVMPLSPAEALGVAAVAAVVVGVASYPIGRALVRSDGPADDS